MRAVTVTATTQGIDMRAPNESLEDFINRADTRKPPEPPAPKSVGLTGEVEVVKPLPTKYEFAAHKAADTSLLYGFYGLSWFHRSLIVGGSLTVVALVIWTGILLGVRRPPLEPVGNFADTFVRPDDVAMDEQSGDLRAAQEQPTSSDLLSQSNSPFSFRESHPARSRVKSWAARRPKPRTFLAAYRPRHFFPAPQFIVSSFVPTTLVIYVENGEIKTRTEPWLTAGFKPSLSN